MCKDMRFIKQQLAITIDPDNSFDTQLHYSRSAAISAATEHFDSNVLLRKVQTKTELFSKSVTLTTNYYDKAVHIHNVLSTPLQLFSFNK